MSYIIWIVITVVIIIMAIIGYVAEHAGEKSEEDKAIDAFLEDTELKEGAATWSKDAKSNDEKQETEHKVASIDDWSNIPKVEETLPKEKSEKPKTEEKINVVLNESTPSVTNDNKHEIGEPTTEVLTVSESMDVPTPLSISVPQPVELTTLPTSKAEVKSASIQTDSSSDFPSVSMPEKINDPVSTENIWS